MTFLAATMPALRGQGHRSKSGVNQYLVAIARLLSFEANECGSGGDYSDKSEEQKKVVASIELFSEIATQTGILGRFRLETPFSFSDYLMIA